MGSWSLGLLNLLKDPKSWIISNNEAVVVADKFPKSKYHFLVLPRENIPTIFQVWIELFRGSSTNTTNYLRGIFYS